MPAAEPGPAETVVDGGADAIETAVAAAVEEPAVAVSDTAQAAAEAIAQAAEPVAQAAEPVAQAAQDLANAIGEKAASAASMAAPEVETTTFIPATPAEAGSSEGGGEWELLLSKVQAWLGQGKLQSLWDQARTPLTLILAASALLVVLRVYTALLAAIDSLPLIPGLLELVGVIWALRFGMPKLVQRSQRQELISGLQQRWRSFRGRD